MNLIIDIGGTNIRFLIDNILIKEKHNFNCLDDIIYKIENFIKSLERNEKEIINVIIGIPGIIDNYISYNLENLNYLYNLQLPKKILNYKTTFINDGDLALIGEINYNKLDKNKRIMSLLFGTGVGCGLWINDLIVNSEAYLIFEEYLGGKNIEKKLDKIKKENEFIISNDEDDSWLNWYYGKEDYLYNNEINTKVIHKENLIHNQEEYNIYRKNIILESKNKYIKDLEKLIQLLNLDILIINGFLNNYEEMKININNLKINDYYKNKFKIIYSSCKEPVLEGGKYI